MSEIVTRFTQAIICPHCGYDMEDDGGDVVHEDREVEWECYRCDRPFLVRVYYSRRYISRTNPAVA